MAKKASKPATPDSATPLSSEYSAYLNEISQYDKKSIHFHDRGEKIVKRYLDERQQEGAMSGATKFNILWSNTETLVPACYAKTPIPIVERRNKDKDAFARNASEILERSLTYFMDCGGFSSIMEQCVIDKLLPGRGVSWIRYVPKFRPLQMEGNQDEAQGLPKAAPSAGEESNALAGEESDQLEEVYDEEVAFDYVHWKDFGHNICRTWDEVWLTWRRVYLTRKELVKRFGADKGKLIPLDYEPEKEGSKDSTVTSKACIYEMWDKRAGQTVWLSKSYKDIIDTKEDPLQLPGFFPHPRPMFATLANKSMLPVPYYAEYQDQARELDNLTMRIAAITKSLKVTGIYDVSAEGLQRMLNEGTENTLIPVERFAGMKDKGGLTGSFELWPLDQIADTLMKLYQARDQVKQDLYEVSGMPDIIRGSSDPTETATAQTIKGQFGSMRLRKMQDDVQRYCRDVLVLAGSVIAKQFSWTTLRDVSGVKLLTVKEKADIQMQAQKALQTAAQQPGAAPPDPSKPQPPPPGMPTPDQIELLAEPSWEDIEALLKDNAQRGFRIEIETDSTIGGDDLAEKQNRLEFLQTAQGLMSQAIQAGESMPVLAPLLMEMVMFGVRSFKSARTLEGQIETTLMALKKQLSVPKPDPKAGEQQAQQQTEQAKGQIQIQLEQMRGQVTMQIEQGKIQAQSQLAQQRAQLDQQTALSQQQAQAAQAHQEQQLEAQRDALKMQNDKELAQFKANLDMQLEMRKAELAMQTAIEVAKINAASKVQSAIATAVPGDSASEPFVQAQGDS